MRKANFTIAQNVWGWLLALTLTAVAGAGLNAQCSLTCNDLVQISLGANCSVEILPDMITEGAIPGGCGTVRVQAKINNLWVPAIPAGQVVPATNYVVGSGLIGQTVQVRVISTTGNTCWGYIKVEDKLAPIPVCSNITVPCAYADFSPAQLAKPFAQGGLNLAAAVPYANDNCNGVVAAGVYADTWTDLPCTPAGPYSGFITRVWQFTDASGNSASCTQTINILRANISNIVFPIDVTVACGPNASTNYSSTGTPSVFFNTVTGLYVAGPGANVVKLSIYPNANSCELQATYDDQVLDVCDGTYKILRTWTVYDWCTATNQTGGPAGNPASFIQLIKVSDATGPYFVDLPGVNDTPADFTVSTDAYTCNAVVDLGSFVVSDACSRINHALATVTVRDQYTNAVIGTHSVSSVLTTFSGNNLWNPDTLANFGATQALPIGTHDVVYTLTDDCGNHYSTPIVHVTVQDLTPPVAVCDEWTQVALGSDGTILVNASTFDDGSYDNCNAVEFKVRRMDTNTCDPNTHFDDKVKFCCEDLGDTITVIFRVFDVDMPAGAITNAVADTTNHYNDCMVQVLVEDKLKPVCSAPANVTVSCELFDASLWAYGAPTATDNNTCCAITPTPGATGVLAVNYGQFDSLCNRGTIVRTWTAKDCANNTSTCQQRIFVNYNQNYSIKFPDDKVLSVCNGNANPYGAPTFTGEDCELLATSYVDEIFTVVPDACFKIERTWTVINWCTYTPNTACTYVNNPDASTTGATVAAPAGDNCYKYKQIIKIIDTQDPTVVTPAPTEFCDYSTNDANYWNASYWWDGPIESHNMCEGEADIAITATDACSGSNVSFRYLLFLDLDGNGTMETVVPGNTVTTVFNEVRFNNVNTPNYAGGEVRAFDFRNVQANQKWGFGLTVDAASGNNRTAHVRWVSPSNGAGVVPQLPYGTHKIKWFIEDGCGNDLTSETTFTVKDCKKPTVVCINGLSINQMNGPMNTVTLWASDFLVYGEDNCTPSGLLKYGIRKSGSGTGFPETGGVAQTSVTFGCTELNTQFVELWVKDKAGNADFCETYVLVQDNTGACGPVAGMATVAGALKTEATEGVQEAEVKLTSSANGAPVGDIFSSVSGNYSFSNAVPVASNATVTPVLDGDPLNGVNTWDLVLISRHILGLEPLNTPYKLIAADANKSGTVTTFDIVELRKLILGTYTALPNNTSWRFIDKSQVFTDNANPFANTINESLQIANIQNNVMNGDFVGAKVGDVDGTATPNSLVVSDDRSAGTLFFDIADRKVAAGEEVVVNFNGSEKNGGYQFTMNFNGLEVMDIAPVANTTVENFGVFANAITASADANAAFSVKFRATAAGQLSEMLSVSSRITKSEAYTVEGARQDVAFRFNGANGSVVGAGFELLQNTPNPVKNVTTVAFNLPTAADATLTITNVEGRVIKSIKGNFAKGLNTVQISRSDLESGVLFYQVNSGDFSAVKKMIVVE